MSATIDRLIVNSPYEEPQRHWRYDREARLFDQVDSRRPAGVLRFPATCLQRTSPIARPGISNRQAVRPFVTRLPLT